MWQDLYFLDLVDAGDNDDNKHNGNNDSIDKCTSRIVLSASMDKAPDVIQMMAELHEGDIVEAMVRPWVGRDKGGMLRLFFLVDRFADIRRVELTPKQQAAREAARQLTAEQLERRLHEGKEHLRAFPRPRLSRLVLRNMLHLRRTRIVVFAPTDSDGRADFFSLRANRLFYRFYTKTVVFAPADLCNALHTHVTRFYDALVIARGGGSGISDIDMPDVWNALAFCPITVIFGAGHTTDSLRLQNVVDIYCPVPYRCATLLLQIGRRALAIILISALALLATALYILLFLAT